MTFLTAFLAATTNRNKPLTREQMEVLDHVWENSKLEIAHVCTHLAGELINSILQLHDDPEVANLRSLVEERPFDVVIHLMDKFVVPWRLWDRFLGNPVLERVCGQFFNPALRGTLGLVS